MKKTIAPKPMGGYKSSSISWLRITATIAVVFSHACSTLAENEIFVLTNGQRVFYEFWLNISKWPVPCFFMLTGVLMLNSDRKITMKDAVMKCSKRVFLALLIFGIPFAMMALYFDTRTLSLSMIPTAIINTLCNESFGHLWYLFKLIGLYLLLPLLKAFVDYAEEKQYRGVLTAIFALNFCIPLFNDLVGTSIAFEIPIGTFVFYALLGQYLVRYENIWFKKKTVDIIQIVIVTALTAIVSIFRGPLEPLLTYTSPVNVLLSVGIFSLFMMSEGKPTTESIWRIDRLCFGVYLVHPVFIHFTYKFLRVLPTHEYLYPLQIVLFTAAFGVLSFIVSWVMSLIKPLKKYVL